MKAVEARLLKLLEAGKQFVIPIYQRTYSWRKSECEQLWQDILRAGSSDSINAHFVGSVVHIQQDEQTAVLWSPLMVIDGQQRLTTISLLLAALAEHVGDSEPVEGFSALKIRYNYLLNHLESGEKKHRLLLSQTDKASLCAIVAELPEPSEPSIRIYENLVFFREKLKEAPTSLEAVCRGISKLMIVDVSLTRGIDNPQLVFESLNSTGRELSQADLIRNYVLMSLEPDLQTKLYESYWRPMEVEFGQEGYLAYFDGFMRDFLTFKTGEIPNISKVYEAFKAHAKSEEEKGIESTLADIRRFSSYYCAMALGKEKDPELRAAFHDLKELRVEVSYPLLLELYEGYDKGELSNADFVSALRLIESYVFRRSVCAIPTNSLNKTFSTFGRSLKKDRWLESMQAAFLSLPSYRRFPNDEEFKRELKARDLYNIRGRAYWLRKLENFDRKEPAQVEEYTIEHILPQADNDPSKLPHAWRAMLGDDWQRVWETLRHSLGNLTLTGYNSEYSNKAFLDKRDMKGGFADSPLRLNSMLKKLESWDEEAILERANQLSDLAINIWGSPKLDPVALASYREVKAGGGLSLEDHSPLKGGPMRALFDALRSEVLAIDPVVREVITKSYVAYKAETNFVDVLPQIKRLWLIIGISIVDLDDPRGLAEDIQAFGWTGNGGVRVSITSVDEIPYAMGLIRQAFDRQMGEISV